MSRGRYQTIGEHYGRLKWDSQLWTGGDWQQTCNIESCLEANLSHFWRYYQEKSVNVIKGRGKWNRDPARPYLRSRLGCSMRGARGYSGLRQSNSRGMSGPPSSSIRLSSHHLGREREIAFSCLQWGLRQQEIQSLTSWVKTGLFSWA